MNEATRAGYEAALRENMQNLLSLVWRRAEDRYFNEVMTPAPPPLEQFDVWVAPEVKISHKMVPASRLEQLMEVQRLAPVLIDDESVLDAIGMSFCRPIKRRRTLAGRSIEDLLMGVGKAVLSFLWN